MNGILLRKAEKALKNKKEKTLVLLKPEALRRKLVGEIIRRIEEADLSIEELKMQQYSRRIISELYQEHESKDFFPSLVKHMTSGPIIALKLSGPKGIIKKMRKINGSTDPVEANPGTIRGDLSCTMEPDNLVHASDSKENSERELALFFSRGK